MHQLKLAWLKARIAWHRQQAEACERPVVRTVIGRDHYMIWLRGHALRHAVRARDLQRRLLIAGG